MRLIEISVVPSFGGRIDIKKTPPRQSPTSAMMLAGMKDKMLIEITGQDSAYWIGRVQALIWSYVDDAEAVHPECDYTGWMSELSAEVETEFESIDRKIPVDGNMACSAAMAIILTTWTVRISHAKAYDPNRPVGIRRRVLKGRLRNTVMALQDAIFDESQDHVYFPQKWDPPFSPDAKSGKFI